MESALTYAAQVLLEQPGVAAVEELKIKRRWGRSRSVTARIRIQGGVAGQTLMKTSIVLVVLAAFAAFAWYLLPSPPRADAEAASGGHAGHVGDPAAVSEGVVVAVDRAANMVTISHGPLVNLGMPPMTMGFRVGDPALPEQLKAGKRIKFHADAVGGAFTATSIEIAN